MSGVTVKRSSAGLGLFATKAFKKGQRIIEYTGEKISAEEANRRGGRYLFELNDRWTLDGKGREHTARYINHSCVPNAYAELNAAETRVFIVAKQRIEPGEEITYHYGKEYFDDFMEGGKACRCVKCEAK
jgi:uncharacterized protein